MNGQNDLRARCLGIRKVLKWTQHDLARATKIYRSKISDWERAHVDLNEDEVARVEAALADAFGERRRELDCAEVALAGAYGG